MHTSQQGTTAAPRPARMIAVVGATGGCGSSTFAAALARTLRRTTGEATLVDLDVPGPGIDVLLGVEGMPGARWPDLSDARGTVEGAGLLAALPRWSAVPVLSASRHAPTPPQDAVVLDVTTALVRAGQRVVVDLPGAPAWGPAIRSLLAACDAVVLLVPPSACGVAGALACLGTLAALDVADVHLVAGPPGPGRVDAAEVGRALGRPVVATVARDARQPTAVERGDGPRTGRRTAAGRAAAQVLAALPAVPGTPASARRATAGATVGAGVGADA
ncbi:P-loop NTPase [Isoptericola aurantiacus]|uniref:P-loop NTPase n=1 Tax=Isoptericola aurantiacus TaxID=3377839 RepID=UPI00383AA602